MLSGAFLLPFAVAVVTGAVSPEASGGDLMSDARWLSRILGMRDEAVVLVEPGSRQATLCIAAVSDVPDHMISLKLAELMCRQKALATGTSDISSVRRMVEVDSDYDRGQNLYVFAFHRAAAQSGSHRRLRRLVSDAIAQNLRNRQDESDAITR